MRDSFLLVICFQMWAANAVAGAWAAEPPVATLPDWFEGHRVQLHIEQRLETILELTPLGLARADRSLGASVATHIIKTLGEGACWPTQVGQVHRLTASRDLVAEMVTAYHAEGLRLIGYYRHMCDDAMQAQHPDWICRDAEGKPVFEPRISKRTPRPELYVLCMNSPYREYTKARLLELAEHGIDVIYFDSWHIPPICTCEHCRRAFQKEMGHAMEPTAAPGSPAYLEIIAFINRSIVQTFTEWHQAVRARNPRVFFAISSSMYPVFATSHLDERLLAISDTSKTEFHKPFGGELTVMAKEIDFARPAYDDQLALGWSLVRDASSGRPPLMWIPYLASEKTATYSAAAAMTYGCIASLHGELRKPVPDMQRNRERFQSVFALGDRVSPYLANARPWPLAAIHISERARNARLAGMPRMWREVFSPALGACRALRESHTPWTVLTDEQLAAGPSSETRLLILPWPDELNSRQMQAVSDWERGGGTVIRFSANDDWSRQAGLSSLLNALKGTIQEKTQDWPIQIQGPASMHAMCFRKPDTRQLVICLSNTWAWFRSSREPRPGEPDRPEPPACDDVAITFSSTEGRPGKAIDAATGAALPFTIRDGRTTLRVPRFQVFACVVADF